MTKIWYLTLAFFWYLRACFCILHIHIVMFSLDSPDLKWPNSAEIISLQSLGAWNEKLVQIGQNLASIKIYSFSNKRKLNERKLKNRLNNRKKQQIGRHSNYLINFASNWSFKICFSSLCVCISFFKFSSLASKCFNLST